MDVLWSECMHSALAWDRSVLPPQPGTATGCLPRKLVGSEQGCISAGIGRKLEDSPVSLMGAKLSSGNGSVILERFSRAGSDQETITIVETLMLSLEISYVRAKKCGC